MCEHDVYPGPLEEAVQTPYSLGGGDWCEPDLVREHRKVRIGPTIERTGERDNRVVVFARIQSEREFERKSLCTAPLTSPYDMQDTHWLILPCRVLRRELPEKKKFNERHAHDLPRLDQSPR
jgi:hypothetical protein